MTKIYGQTAIAYATANDLNLNTDEERGLSITEAKAIEKNEPGSVWVDTSADPEDGSNVGERR